MLLLYFYTIYELCFKFVLIWKKLKKIENKITKETIALVKMIGYKYK